MHGNAGKGQRSLFSSAAVSTSVLSHQAVISILSTLAYMRVPAETCSDDTACSIIIFISVTVLLSC